MSKEEFLLELRKNLNGLPNDEIDNRGETETTRRGRATKERKRGRRKKKSRTEKIQT